MSQRLLQSIRLELGLAEGQPILPALREAISDEYKQKHGLNVSVEELTGDEEVQERVHNLKPIDVVNKLKEIIPREQFIESVKRGESPVRLMERSLNDAAIALGYEGIKDLIKHNADNLSSPKDKLDMADIIQDIVNDVNSTDSGLMIGAIECKNPMARQLLDQILEECNTMEIATILDHLEKIGDIAIDDASRNAIDRIFEESDETPCSGCGKKHAPVPDVFKDYMFKRLLQVADTIDKERETQH